MLARNGNSIAKPVMPPLPTPSIRSPSLCTRHLPTTSLSSPPPFAHPISSRLGCCGGMRQDATGWVRDSRCSCWDRTARRGPLGVVASRLLTLESSQGKKRHLEAAWKREAQASLTLFCSVDGRIGRRIEPAPRRTTIRNSDLTTPLLFHPVWRRSSSLPMAACSIVVGWLLSPEQKPGGRVPLHLMRCSCGGHASVVGPFFALTTDNAWCFRDSLHRPLPLCICPGASHSAKEDPSLHHTCSHWKRREGARASGGSMHAASSTSSALTSDLRSPVFPAWKAN